jgi:hypothetical protein
MNEHKALHLHEGEGKESVRAEISRQMVRLYKDLFGRGPTKVRTEFAGPDILDRRVEAFVSGMDTKRDVAAEIFYLEPRQVVAAAPHTDGVTPAAG